MRKHELLFIVAAVCKKARTNVRMEFLLYVSLVAVLFFIDDKNKNFLFTKTIAFELIHMKVGTN